jgi:hypothetical protein
VPKLKILFETPPVRLELIEELRNLKRLVAPVDD